MKMNAKKLPPISSPTMFATATARSRKIRSGISGAAVRIRARPRWRGQAIGDGVHLLQMGGRRQLKAPAHRVRPLRFDPHHAHRWELELYICGDTGEEATSSDGNHH